MEIKAAQTSHKGSGKHLVLADERANAGALLEKLREVALHDRKATFTLLVPAKPAGRSFTWTEGQSIAAARRTAMVVRRWLERAGSGSMRPLSETHRQCRQSPIFWCSAAHSRGLSSPRSRGVFRGGLNSMFRRLHGIAFHSRSSQ